MNSRSSAVSLAVLAVLASSGAAQATNGTSGTASGDVSITQPGTTTPPPTDITITGDPGTGSPPGGSGAIVLDGDYAVAAGGTRTTAVLGAVTFDPAGTIVGGTLSFIGASPVTPTPEPTPTPGPTTGAATTATLTPAAMPIATTTTGGDPTGGGDSLGPSDPSAPSDPGSGGGASVVDCTVSGGTYTLASGGGGEAQLQLECAGSSLAATWRLFVTGTQGMAVAQQFRAVQLEALPGAIDPEIVDLTLTLR